jgi:hypothetical protein
MHVLDFTEITKEKAFEMPQFLLTDEFSDEAFKKVEQEWKAAIVKFK